MSKLNDDQLSIIIYIILSAVKFTILLVLITGNEVPPYELSNRYRVLIELSFTLIFI